MKKWKLAREPCEKMTLALSTKKIRDLQESPMKKMTLALPKNGVTCKRAL